MPDPIYLDHAATTPLAPEVVTAMQPWTAAGAVGNASSLHSFGRRARAAVEDARDQVADALGVTPLEVLFTSGGTEADNQAIKGLAWAAEGSAGRPHLLTTAIEHHAVIETVEWLRDHGHADATIVGVGRDGLLDPEEFLAGITDQTAVASVMAANNELGTIQPLDVLGPALADRGIPLHVDAVQAFGKIPMPLVDWQATSLALSAHKFNGPTGVGVLVLRRDADLHPVLHGGGQERGVRSGTLNVAGIVGLGAAAQLTAQRQPAEQVRLTGLRDQMIVALTSQPGITLNGHPTIRLPHTVHVAVAGLDGESLLLALDRVGVACATGSACQSGAAQRSHVLDAIGAAEDAAHIRLSLGGATTPPMVEDAATRFLGCVRALRSAPPTVPAAGGAPWPA